jgi:two-component system, NtrC family, sensor histidine kinase HydH
MERGGTLSLRLAWAGRSERLRDRRPGGARDVVIEIGDTGPGIRPEDAERLFNPFFTTKERGTGLGLAVTHKIIEDHGGAIDFSSTRGVGTTFRIMLPLTPLVVDAPSERR